MVKLFWVNSAWNMLSIYCSAHGIPLSTALRGDMSLVRSRRAKGSNVSESDLQRAINRVKIVFSGYYIITTTNAPDTIVDAVFEVLEYGINETVLSVEGYSKKSFDTLLLDEIVRDGRFKNQDEINAFMLIHRADKLTGYLGALERVNMLRSAFMLALDRKSRVFAIETAVNMMHEEGMEILIIIANCLRDGRFEREIIPKLLNALRDKNE